MRLNQAIVAFAGAVLLVWGPAAQAEPVKIGVIDLQQAVVSTEDGRKVREELEAKAQAAQKQLQPKLQKFQELQAEVQEMQHVLSQEALQKRQFDLMEMQGQIENEGRGLEQQLKLDEARLMAPLQEKFGTVVERIGKEKDFSLILLRGSPGLAYAREALDITDLVIAEFDKK
ncbi:MAG: OmpH family outer membrane protein [Myxococcota bacterium]